MKIWNKITNEPWATTSDTLENIINIAQRQNANPAAIAAQLGRKLQNTYAVSTHSDQNRMDKQIVCCHGFCPFLFSVLSVGRDKQSVCQYLCANDQIITGCILLRAMAEPAI